MRQQLVDAAGRLHGQPLEDVPQVCVGIVPIEPRRMHQAHDCGGALTCAAMHDEAIDNYILSLLSQYGRTAAFGQFQSSTTVG